MSDITNVYANERLALRIFYRDEIDPNLPQMKTEQARVRNYTARAAGNRSGLLLLKYLIVTFKAKTCMAVFKIDFDICSFDEKYINEIPKIADWRIPRLYATDLREVDVALEIEAGLAKKEPRKIMGYRLTAVRFDVDGGKYSYCYLPYYDEKFDNLQELAKRVGYAIMACPGGLIRNTWPVESVLLKTSEELVAHVQNEFNVD